MYMIKNNTFNESVRLCCYVTNIQFTGNDNSLDIR